MSTSAEFTDGTHFAESAKLVRDDSAAEKYVIVGHVDGNPNHVAVQKVGYDVSELPNETDDTQVLYILARYESTFDMSSTVKFVYFRWIGDGVPYVKRGKYGVVHGSIQEHFNPYHLFIETSSREDFDPEKINQQLEETTGKKSKVLESSRGRQERGFTATQLPNRDHQVASVPPMAREGAKIEISTEVFTAIAAVRSNEDPTRWMLAEYRDGNSKGPLDLTAQGEGDAEQLRETLADDKVMYGLYRVKDTMDDITTVKFVYIVWYVDLM
ncbi:hypothetical protein CHS0354_001414 [Potamilus streckersoni]|uniref:Coactosin-like protein n=1 Tax=Potamilus streckersoni TaxID=2493646 RepID=A0AAE0W8E2_9BIVA|nr:hypothetical protein CHS0354_001414 [Potamilus streckersoni]